MSPQTLFRRLAVAEAVTWALLLTGMVLKYVTRTTELGVEVFGMVHGVVFVAVNQRWSATTTLTGLAAAIPPFATVWFERRVERRGLLTGPWRLAPGGTDRARGPLERTQAWMLRRPATAVVVAVVAVAVLTAAALVVGPPVPPQS